MSPEATRRALLQMLNTRLIPQVTGQEPLSLVFMEPQSLHRHRKDITSHRGHPLPDGVRLRSSLFLQRWKNQKVHAVRFPCLAAVVEGEVDWRIGITQSMRQPPASEPTEATLRDSNYLIVPLSEGTFFLMPPGVPYSDGRSIHWERPFLRDRPATVFWILIFPAGIMCHFCHSTATEHRGQRPLFLPCPQIHQLAKMLEKEMEQEQPGSDLIARTHLLGILGYVRRELQQRTPTSCLNPEAMLHEVIRENSGGSRDALQLAWDFIEAHLPEPLDPARISEHAYLSARQLDRHFQRETGMSMMDYVISRRLEMAKALLQDTDLTVGQIGVMVGYRNPSSFTQIFKRRLGMSPAFYRQWEKTALS